MGLGVVLWLLAIAALLVVVVAPVAALSSNEIILFENTQASCYPGGQGLYLTGDANSLGAWGFDDRASGWKRGSGDWKAFSDNNYSGPVNDLTATYDCDLTNNGYPGGGSWNDKFSSVDVAPFN